MQLLSCAKFRRKEFVISRILRQIYASLNTNTQYIISPHMREFSVIFISDEISCKFYPNPSLLLHFRIILMKMNYFKLMFYKLLRY